MVKWVVWHRLCSQDAARPPRLLLDALGEEGVGVLPAHAESSTGPGLVLFDEVTPALLDCLREVSRGGIARVLAVALSPDALGRQSASHGAAWRLLRSGASDVVVVGEPVGRVAADIATRIGRWAEVDALLAQPTVQDTLVGASPVWIAALRRVAEVARYSGDAVLLLGETGTGKELAARLVHALDARPRRGELVVADCGTIVPELSGSELFGHVRGAYTGAVATRDGAFALADGGTLFLDEVGELPAALQTELLRAVQERTFKRVGSNNWQQANFRLVSATNRDLAAEIARGGFRRDLYHRIASVTIALPPLRDRPEDILPLARHFMAELTPRRDPPPLDDAVAELIQRRPYPGNVRELRQLVTRIMHRHAGPGPVTVGDVPEEERPPRDAAEPWGEWRDESFENAIRRAVAHGVRLRDIGHAATETAIRIACSSEGSLQHAARRLGVTDRALQIRRAAKRQQDDGPAARAD